MGTTRGHYYPSFRSLICLASINPQPAGGSDCHAVAPKNASSERVLGFGAPHRRQKPNSKPLEPKIHDTKLESKNSQNAESL